MVIPESCPTCGSTRYKKNGHTRHGKQHHLCKNCERQLSAGADNLLISSERRAEIANLLRERLSLRGICRAVGVSLTWLLHFMVECFATCPDHLHVRLPTRPAKVLIELFPNKESGRLSSKKLWRESTGGDANPRRPSDESPHWAIQSPI